MTKRLAAVIDKPAVVLEPIPISALNDLDDITRWLGTFRARLAASREAQRSETAIAVDQLEARYRQRRAELA